MTRTRRIAFRLIAVLLALALVEAGLRIAGVAYPAWDRPTPGLGEWGVPNARGWAVGEARQFVELNGEGARDVDHAVAKPPDVHRILVLGDSYAAAFEVRREEAFWSVMGDRLGGCDRLSGRRVEVINLSKRGYGTADELLLWRRLGAKYAPDEVVLAFYTGNDLRNNSPELKQADRPYFRLDGEALELDASYAARPDFRFWVGWPGDLWYGLVRHVRLVQVARQVRRQIKAALEVRAAMHAERGEGGEPGIDDGIYLEPRDPAWRAAWAISERLVRQLRDEVEASGARFVLMTLSTAAQVHPDPARRHATAERLGVADLDHPERRFEAWTRAEGIRWVSAVPALRRAAESTGECVHGFPGPWACQGHWNERGHRLAGALLADALCAASAETDAAPSGAGEPAPRASEAAARADEAAARADEAAARADEAAARADEAAGTRQAAERSPASMERASRP
ncbi:MAG: SGNH/GDSL hydrolase family protein [Myxococcota bacterium]